MQTALSVNSLGIGHLAAQSQGMTTPKLLSHLRNGILTLSLNRPDKLNAIDHELALALHEALQAAARDESVRVVVLEGKGRAFCAGRDVSAPPTEDDLVRVQAVAQAMVELPQPVVAAVHGWTLGAGLEWMLNAGVVLAASSARFRLPEASLGVFVTGGLTATLTASAGLARAKALMLLGQEFSPVQAQAWGLIWGVTAPEGLREEAQSIAQQLANLQPEVARRFKRVLNDIGLAQFSKAIERENEAQRAIEASRVG